MSFILPNESLRADHIVKPFLAVCEGMSDATFVDRLLRHSHRDNCHVACPSEKNTGATGLGGIASYLAGVQVLIKGKDVLRGIAVVADADRLARKRFKQVAKAFEDATFPKPDAPFQICDQGFRVAVYLIPAQGRPGTLEHLLLDAALHNRPQLAQCLEDFCNCTKRVKKWKSNERAKMRMSSLVAASCQKNPWASANTMWSDKGCPVPIGSDRFREIRDFLLAFTHP